MIKDLFKIVLGFACCSAPLIMAAEGDCFFFSQEMARSHLKDYTAEEKEAIEKDLSVVRSVCFTPASEKKEGQKPLYLATAGAPGSRKTTILERFLKRESLSPHIVYLDPDHRGLKFMSHTYYSRSLCALVAGEQKEYIQVAKNAYEKWRGASNYIAVTLLEEAFKQRRDIAHGTTLTGDHIPSFLSKVKEAGYEVTLLLCLSDDAFRKKAVQYRNEEQKFYQSTPEDVLGKWKAFPQKMSTFFTFGDNLYLFWSDDLDTPERLAVTFMHGRLEVLDEGAFDLFVRKFERDRDLLIKEGKQVPSWKELVDLYQSRFY